MSTLRRSSRLAEKASPQGTVGEAAREARDGKKGGKKGGKKEKNGKKGTVELVTVTEEVIVIVEQKVEDEEDECTRSITFNPCKHSAHRTCGIKWLETRSSEEELSCPVCRTAVQVLIDRTRPSNPTYLWLATNGNALFDIQALGPLGQPTKYGILNDLKKIQPEFFHNSLRNHLSYLSTATSKMITDLKQTLAEAKSAKMSKQYITDISQELAKMKRRNRILADMTRVQKRGGMRREEMDDEEVEWNYALELEALRAL